MSVSAKPVDPRGIVMVLVATCAALDLAQVLAGASEPATHPLAQLGRLAATILGFVFLAVPTLGLFTRRFRAFAIALAILLCAMAVMLVTAPGKWWGGSGLEMPLALLAIYGCIRVIFIRPVARKFAGE